MIAYTIEEIRAFVALVADDPLEVPRPVMQVFTRTDINVAQFLLEQAEFVLTYRGKQLLAYREDVQYDLWMNLLRLCNE